MHTEILRTFNIGAHTVTLTVVSYDQPTDWLAYMFDTVARHEGGVTVRNPVNPGDDRHCQWFRPTQYTLAELASDYAKQGRENPSSAAYESAQRELGWYITAGDYGLSVQIEKHGVELADINAGFGFVYSWEYSDQNLEDYTLANFRDVIRETLHEAIAEARNTLRTLCE